MKKRQEKPCLETARNLLKMGLSGAIFGFWEALFGLLEALGAQEEAQEGPKGGPEGLLGGSKAEKKKCKEVPRGSWPVLRRDFSQNAPPRAPQEGPKRGSGGLLSGKSENHENIGFPIGKRRFLPPGGVQVGLLKRSETHMEMRWVLGSIKNRL